MKNNKHNNFIKSKAIGDLNELTAKALYVINDSRFKNADQKKIIKEYCIGSINNITYTEDEETIYNFYFDNILRNRDFEGEVTENDVRVIIQYFSLKKLKELNINAHFEVYRDTLYTLKFGLLSTSCCQSFKDGSSIINFRNSLFKKAIDEENSFNQEKLFSLLEIAYHEIIHAKQNDMIHKQHNSQIEDKQVLLWIKENMIDDYDPMYYMKNCEDMFIERDACTQSGFLAIDTFRKHFSCVSSIFLYEKEKELLEKYYEEKNMMNPIPLTNYPNQHKTIEEIDSYIDSIAIDYPVYVYEILGIQYNKNGERRNEKELSEEYYSKKSLIESTYQKGTKLYYDKINTLDELYNYLIWGAKEAEMYSRVGKINTKIKKRKY